MIYTEKCYYLRQEIDASRLLDFDFETKNNGRTYFRDCQGCSHGEYITYYSETNRFVVRYPGYREGAVRKVKRHIRDLILNEIVEIRPTAIYLNLNPFTDWRNFSKEKIKKIEKKLALKQIKLDSKK